MMTRFFYSLILILTLSVAPALAQPNALRGTWSGHWISPSGVRDAVTLRFSIEDDALVGEMVNPESVTFDNVSFDDQHLSVVAEAETAETGKIRVEARIEDETRLDGTVTLGDKSGEMKLTKWTFVPLPR